MRDLFGKIFLVICTILDGIASRFRLIKKLESLYKALPNSYHEPEDFPNPPKKAKSTCNLKTKSGNKVNG